MRLLLLTAAAAMMAAASAFAATVSGSTGYALSNSGKSLTVFSDLSNTSSATTIKLEGGSLDAIAYRPVTGELYGYSADKKNEVFLIDTVSGKLTSTGADFDKVARIKGARVGFDFNNAIDAARAVSTKDDNLVFFPDNFPNAENAGTVKRFTDLSTARAM